MELTKHGKLWDYHLLRTGEKHIANSQKDIFGPKAASVMYAMRKVPLKQVFLPTEEMLGSLSKAAVASQMVYGLVRPISEVHACACFVNDCGCCTCALVAV